MPFKDRADRNAYLRKRYASMRQAWFDVNGPCVDCGTWVNLELDHADPTTKVTHNVWNWPRLRRESELAKCVARCAPCHMEKTKAETLRKRYCVRGHDTWESGRDVQHRCLQCRVEVEYPKRIRKGRGDG